MQWKKLALTGLGMVALVVSTGCSATPVQFAGPPGTTMMVDKKSYTLPATVPVPAQSGMMGPPGGAGSGATMEVRVEFLFPELHAVGVMKTFRYSPTTADKYSSINCTITPADISKMAEGSACIVTGTSASGQTVFEITMGKQK